MQCLWLVFVIFRMLLALSQTKSSANGVLFAKLYVFSQFKHSYSSPSLLTAFLSTIPLRFINSMRDYILTSNQQKNIPTWRPLRYHRCLYYMDPWSFWWLSTAWCPTTFVSWRALWSYYLINYGLLKGNVKEKSGMYLFVRLFIRVCYVLPERLFRLIKFESIVSWPYVVVQAWDCKQTQQSAVGNYYDVSS